MHRNRGVQGQEYYSESSVGSVHRWLSRAATIEKTIEKTITIAKTIEKSNKHVRAY
jgi:hypothetical protein